MGPAACLAEKKRALTSRTEFRNKLPDKNLAFRFLAPISFNKIKTMAALPP